MKLKHIKLFESFISNKINEGNGGDDSKYSLPKDFPGTQNYNVANDKYAHKGMKFDKNRYPEYINEAADRLNAWIEKSKENNLGRVIYIKSSDSYLLINQYDNGLWYAIKPVKKENLEDYEKKGEPVKKPTIPQEIPEVEPVKAKEIEFKEKEKQEQALKTFDLDVWRKGSFKRKKVRKDAAGNKVKSLRLVGNLGKEINIGYGVVDGNMFFNDHEGNGWSYNPETGEAIKVNKEEVNLNKYKTPKKREFKKFLKEYDIKL